MGNTWTAVEFSEAAHAITTSAITAASPETSQVASESRQATKCGMYVRGVIIVSWMMCFSPMEAKAGADAEDIAARHKAARESVFSFQCRLFVDETFSDGRAARSAPTDYWRKGEIARATWSVEGKGCDVLITDSRVTSVCWPGRGKTPTVCVRTNDGDSLGLSDPSINALLAFCGVPEMRAKPVPFETLLRRYRLKSVRAQKDAVGEAVVLELEIGESIREYWFDPAHNYLIRKFVTTTVDSKAVHEVLQFFEGPAGVFVPQVVRLTSEFGDSGLTSQRTSEFKNIAVNADIPDHMFKLTFPANAEVHDFILNRLFVTDASGNIAGEGTELPSLPPPKEPGRSATPRTETKTEPWPWTSFVLPISIGILLLGTGLAIVRRWRSGETAN